MTSATFETARFAVLKQLRSEWGSTPGTPIALISGYQDDEYWHVIAGASEYLLGGDKDFSLFDSPVWLVRKSTGEVTKASVLEDSDRLAAMVPAP
jgi:hypothetical protein